MDFENKPVDQAADQVAYDECVRIYSDPTHPQYAPFKRGDRSAVEYRDRLMTRAHPGEVAITKNGTEPVEPAPTPPMAPAKPNLTQAGEQAGDVPEIEWTQEAAESSLRMTMNLTGEDYDVMLRETSEGLVGLFAGEEPKLVDKFLRHVGNDPDFILLARRIVQKLKANGR